MALLLETNVTREETSVVIISVPELKTEYALRVVCWKRPQLKVPITPSDRFGITMLTEVGNQTLKFTKTGGSDANPTVTMVFEPLVCAELKVIAHAAVTDITAPFDAFVNEQTPATP